uniref:hypothetical protein n=1 Tax=Streptomyces acidiscabies TaxID=42234 RepID=UPI0021160116
MLDAVTGLGRRSILAGPERRSGELLRRSGVLRRSGRNRLLPHLPPIALVPGVAPENSPGLDTPALALDGLTTRPSLALKGFPALGNGPRLGGPGNPALRVTGLSLTLAPDTPVRPR